MNWNYANQLLRELSIGYTSDNLRKMTYDKEIFPLVMRYENGECSKELFNKILEMHALLMKWGITG